jgi:hypothetical protein
MAAEMSLPELPEELSARIREISIRTGMRDEEIVSYLVHTFLEMVKNPQHENEACQAARIKTEVRQKLGME